MLPTTETRSFWRTTTARAITCRRLLFRRAPERNGGEEETQPRRLVQVGAGVQSSRRPERVRRRGRNELRALSPCRTSRRRRRKENSLTRRGSARGTVSRARCGRRVLRPHEHRYWQSFPVFNETVVNGTGYTTLETYREPEGTVHVVTGAGGNDNMDLGDEPPSSRKCSSCAEREWT